MDFKNDLLRYGQSDSLTLTDSQKTERIDQTISKTFAWVGGLLLISFAIAYSIAVGVLPVPFSSTSMWISWIAGLGIIFLMGWKRQKMSYQTLVALLIAFAVLEGYGLTGVFLSYNFGSIHNVFLATSGMFLGLSIVGYHTKIDIMRVGPILFFALIGLIIAMVANMFINNAQFDVRISVIGLIIFSGFIIYDMNLMKQQALYMDDRTPILMALGMFINFINIFLFILRLTGGD